MKQTAELDAIILQELSEADDKEALGREIEESHDFQIDVKMALEDIKEALVSISGDSGEMDSKGNSQRKSTSMLQSKLPKLTMTRFDGEPKSWMSFWEGFDGSIHSRKDLTDRNKFDYLKGLLDNEPRELVQHFEMNSKSYQAATTLLQERYGDKEKISRIHYNSLMNVKPVFRDSDTEGLKKFYTEVEKKHRALISLGKKQEHYSDLLVPQIEDKLPQNLRISVLQQKGRGTWLMDEMLQLIRQEIRIRESRPQIERTQRWESSFRKRDGAEHSASALFGSKDNVRATVNKDCPYCLGNHVAEECRKVTDVEQRKQVLRKYLRCFSCLKKGHRIKECRSKQKCKKCGNHHHTSICNEKEKDEEIVVPLLHTKAKRSIAMETLQVYVKGKDDSTRVKCRLLLDTGSQFTFITEGLGNLLGVKPSTEAKITLSGIGKSTGVSTTGNVYEVLIEGLDKKHLISTQAYTLPEISRISNVKPHVQQQHFNHLQGLWFPDISDKEELEIHMPVGVSDYHKIQTGKVIRGVSRLASGCAKYLWMDIGRQN